MTRELLAELLELTPAERIQLVEDLWDSLEIEPEGVLPLTPAQQREIEWRLEEHARDPGRASSWEEVRARLWSRFK